MRVIQQPSQGTLIPDRAASVDFDTTRNVVIEGDNLEVLKLLQNSYYGKVKMIYIDPPYNTGNDFIYPDNFSEGLTDYLKYTGQFSKTAGKQSTNIDTRGRLHRQWLNMILPRLFLARNLLQPEGIIAVSIDDNESSALRFVMDEILGEENFLANVVWKHTEQSKNDERYFSRQHNTVLVYGRSEEVKPFNFARTADNNSAYRNPDADVKGQWRAGDVRSPSLRPSLKFDITSPSGQVISPPDNGWRWSKASISEKIRNGEIIFSADERRIVRKIYLAEQAGRTPENLWTQAEAGTTREANAELKSLFEDVPFDTAKPTRLIQRLVELCVTCDERAIVLDFFAGSGTTGHAVMKLNAEDGGNRRYILVQLPEPVDNGGPYRTISEITRERLRRAGSQVREQAAKDGRDVSGLDTGFQAYSLAESNFHQWQGDTASAQFRDGQLGMLENMERQLRLLKDNVRDDRSPRAILSELMLAAGFELTEPVERIAVAGQHAYSVADGALLICLERRIEAATITAMAERDPAQIICLDASFANDDQLRVNAAQTIRARARQHDRTIAFKVV